MGITVIRWCAYSQPIGANKKSSDKAWLKVLQLKCGPNLTNETIPHLEIANR